MSAFLQHLCVCHGTALFAAFTLLCMLVGLLTAGKVGYLLGGRSLGARIFLWFLGASAGTVTWVFVTSHLADGWLVQLETGYPRLTEGDPRIRRGLWAAVMPLRRQTVLLLLSQRLRDGFCGDPNHPRSLLAPLVEVMDAKGTPHDFRPLTRLKGLDYELLALRTCGQRDHEEMNLLVAYARYADAAKVARGLEEKYRRPAGTLRLEVAAGNLSGAQADATRSQDTCLALALQARLGDREAAHTLLRRNADFTGEPTPTAHEAYRCKLLAADLIGSSGTSGSVSRADYLLPIIDATTARHPHALPYYELAWLLVAEEAEGEPPGVSRPREVSELGPESVVLPWQVSYSALHESVASKLEKKATLSTSARLLRAELRIRKALGLGEQGRLVEAAKLADGAVFDWNILRQEPADTLSVPLLYGSHTVAALSEQDELARASFFAQSYALAILVELRAGALDRALELMNDPIMDSTPVVQTRFFDLLRFLETGEYNALRMVVSPIETTEEGLPYRSRDWLLVWQGNTQALLSQWGSIWNGYPTTAISWGVQRIHSGKSELAAHVTKFLAITGNPHPCWYIIKGLGVEADYPELLRAVEQKDALASRRDLAVLLWASENGPWVAR